MPRARLAVPGAGEHKTVPSVQESYQVSDGPVNHQEETPRVRVTIEHCVTNTLT